MTNQNHTCRCHSETLNINLLPFDRDERAVYVESVLDVLCESRFGPGHIYDPHELWFSAVPSEFVNFDLMPSNFAGEQSGSFSPGPIGFSSDQITGGRLSPFRPFINASALIPLHRSPSTLARGSPDHRRPEHRP
jgi:hypothetical protein